MNKWTIATFKSKKELHTNKILKKNRLWSQKFGLTVFDGGKSFEKKTDNCRPTPQRQGAFQNFNALICWHCRFKSRRQPLTILRDTLFLWCESAIWAHILYICLHFICMYFLFILKMSLLFTYSLFLFAFNLNHFTTYIIFLSK